MVNASGLFPGARRAAILILGGVATAPGNVPLLIATDLEAASDVSSRVPQMSRHETDVTIRMSGKRADGVTLKGAPWLCPILKQEISLH
jgi:hypothetical protein